MKDNIWLEN